MFQWLCKQQPRFAQGQPKAYFQMKALDRTTEDIVPMNEMWRKLNANMSQHVSLRANMGQHCSLSAVHRNAACEERMAWINAMAFVPMSLQWFTPRCLHHDGDLCRFACGHQCFFVVAKATAKICPRPAQGLFSNERT